MNVSRLLEQTTRDPDFAAVDWLLHGAPARILTDILGCSIFPQYRPDIGQPLVEIGYLTTLADFANYAGVEESR